MLRMNCAPGQSDNIIALACPINGKRLDIMDIAVRPPVGVLDMKVGAVRHRTSESCLYLGDSGGKSIRGRSHF